MAKKRTWTAEQLKDAVKTSFSYRQVLYKLNLIPAGGNYDQIKKYAKEFGFDTSHFRGKAWNRGLRGIGKPRRSLDKIMVKGSIYQSHLLKNRLFKEGIKNPICELCSWAKKSADGRLPLELDHVNGDRHDNRLENLRILCPNCHSLQPTHRGRNRKKETKKLFI